MSSEEIYSGGEVVVASSFSLGTLRLATAVSR